MARTTATTDVPDALKPVSDALSQLGQRFNQMVSDTHGVSGALANLVQTFASATGAFTSSAASLVSTCGGLASGLGQALTGNLSGAFSTITGAVHGLSVGFVGLMVASGGILETVGALVQAMGGAVAVADPAVFQMFQNAIQDVTTVIGQSFSPILQVVTGMIRMAGDSLASWAPRLGAIAGQLASGLLPIFQILMNVFGKVGQAITMIVTAASPAILAFEQIYTALDEALEPVLNTLVELIAGGLSMVLKWLSEVVLTITPYILAFARVLKDAFEWIGNAIRELAGLAGITMPTFGDSDPKKKDESANAAAKGASIGSVESVMQQAMKSAFSIGMGPKDADPAVRTAGIAEAINGKVDGIINAMNMIPKLIWDNLPGWIKTFLDGMNGAFKKILDTLSISNEEWKTIRENPGAVLKNTVDPKAALSSFNDADKASIQSTRQLREQVKAANPSWSDHQVGMEVQKRMNPEWANKNPLPKPPGAVGG